MSNIAISDKAFMPAEPDYLQISSNNLPISYNTAAMHKPSTITVSSSLEIQEAITLHLVGQSLGISMRKICH